MTLANTLAIAILVGALVTAFIIMMRKKGLLGNDTWWKTKVKSYVRTADTMATLAHRDFRQYDLSIENPRGMAYLDELEERLDHNQESTDQIRARIFEFVRVGRANHFFIPIARISELLDMCDHIDRERSEGRAFLNQIVSSIDKPKEVIHKRTVMWEADNDKGA